MDLTTLKHHPAMEEIVDVLCHKTQNTDRSFFRIETAYYMGKMASTMRAYVATRDRGDITVNVYALLLATSGFGKGYSISIMENELMADFHRNFMDNTFPMVAEDHMWKLANDRAIRFGKEPKEEFDKIFKEFTSLGPYLFTFDSATTPAVKQLRQKLLLASIGAINLQVDEIGLNLTNSAEVLTTFLELYDQGMVKQKLVKNTVDNQRGEDVLGRTPANMLLFGTPSKLLDGSATEDLFYSFLDTGYARRCLFAQSEPPLDADIMSPEEMWEKLINPESNAVIQKWSKHFESLASDNFRDWRITIPDATSIELIRYQQYSRSRAYDMPESAEIQRAEMMHRHSRVLKLAGAYAFIDKSDVITQQNLEQAILLVEESGSSFQKILQREKNYVKVARHLADVEGELTHPDLLDTFPSFYGTSSTRRNELMSNAMAWGYKNHIIITKKFVDGIEFFKADALKQTDLNSIMINWSNHWAEDYNTERAPFEKMHMLTQQTGKQWTNHAFKNNYRTAENTLPGFNMVVLDLDGTASRSLVHELLDGYVFMTYTTKRHRQIIGTDPEGNPIIGPDRFRVMIPINYELNLSVKEYKDFMQSIRDWLPFPTDPACLEPHKTWASHDGEYHVNMDGELLDATQFIPRTSRNDAFVQQNQKLVSLDNLERWFAVRMVEGSRNNEMIKFALALVDNDMPYDQVQQATHNFNKKLGNHALPTEEIDDTIMKTVAQRINKRTV